MRRAVVGLLVSQLALPWAAPRAWSEDDPAREVKKRGSHRKLLIFGLVLVGMIAVGAAIVDAGAI